MSNWKPIETAPKNRLILIRCKSEQWWLTPFLGTIDEFGEIEVDKTHVEIYSYYDISPELRTNIIGNPVEWTEIPE